MALLRRALASFLIFSIVIGPGCLNIQAATIPPVILLPAHVVISNGRACTPCVITDGIQTIVGAASAFLKGNSPAIFGMPVYNSANLTSSIWGTGWVSDMDHSAAIMPDGAVVIIDGSGTQAKFTKVAGTVTPPTYRAPVETQLTLIATVNSSGTVVALTERDTSGTSLLFATHDAAPSSGVQLAAGAVQVLRLTRLTDRNGNSVTYNRNVQGRLTKVTDVHGRYFVLAYNPAGMVASLTDSAGRSVTFAYAANGDKTGEIGADGTFVYNYDAAHHLTRVTYPNGSVSNYNYDAQGRLIYQDDGDGVHAVTFTRNSGSTIITDALGRATTYDFTTRGGASLITKVTDTSGHYATFAYDLHQNLTSATDELDHTVTFAYDDKGKPIAVTDSAGNIGHIAYHPTFSRPVSLTDPLGRASTLNYDAEGNLTSAQGPLKNALSLTYDGSGHVISARNALGGTISMTYDNDGAAITATDELDRTTFMDRDALSRITGMTDPRNNKTTFRYDDSDNLLELKDAMGGVTTIAYTQGREKKLPTSITDAKGHATTLNYDPQGRVSSAVDALGRTTSISYNNLGAPISAQTRNGNTASVSYNNLNRITGLTVPEGIVSTSYDAVGNLVSAAHYNGAGINISYDSLNRPEQLVQTLPNGFNYIIKYTYDTRGNRISMTTPQGTIRYGYDALSRITSITNPFGQTVSFTYDALSRRTKMIYPNGTTTTYAYDATGRVTQVMHKRTSDQVAIAFDEYDYDHNGNATTITDKEGAHIYVYDKLNRLTSAAHPSGTSLPVRNEIFSYDAVGNRLSDAERTGYIYDAANRLIADSSSTYAYDADGNVTSRVDRVTGSTTTFVYNSSDQLILVSASTHTIATYKYDAVGHRVEKNVGGAVTRYIYDGPNMLAALDGNNNVLQFLTQGPGLDAPMLMRQSGTDYFYHEDALGSVTALTDLTGHVLETAEFQAFGKGVIRDALGTPHASSTIGNSFLFAARELDVETGLYFNRARYLDPSIGRFVSEDPLLQINRYSYALNNPITLRDPSGRISCWGPIAEGIAKGIVVGVTIGLVVWSVATAIAIFGFVASLTLIAVGQLLAAVGLCALLWEMGNAKINKDWPKLAYLATTAVVTAAFHGVTSALDAALISEAEAELPAAQELLMPGGRAIGRPGDGWRVRELTGGLAETEAMYNQLARGGIPISNYNGRGVRLPNGGFVGMRTEMSNSPGTAATIDVNIPGVPIHKVKFVP